MTPHHDRDDDLKIKRAWKVKAATFTATSGLFHVLTGAGHHLWLPADRVATQ
jgi:hypothetical protein